MAAVPAILLSLFTGQVILANSASAVTVAKAELKSGQLKVEGVSTPGIFTIASSTTSSAGARSGADGRFVIQASDFTAPDCKITVSDGGRSPIMTAALSGCTPSTKPVTAPAAPTGTCVITPADPATLTLNRSTSYLFTTSGCNTTFNTGATPTPVQWKVVAGSIPTGMTGPNSQGTDAGNIIGTPTVAGTYTFTLQVTDSADQRDQENVTLTVA
ncbi:PKD domain-containing protein [Geodermatophilus sp. URMC 64]